MTPKLLSCIVVHDRPELTAVTIESYLRTTKTAKLLVVYDSGSDAPTAYALDLYRRSGAFVIRSDMNVYPGRACNEAWTQALRLANDCTLLHRSDNDVEYQDGWDDEVVARFAADPRLGQLGLLEEKYEQGCFNVGGNCVIRREIWDAGVRWSEARWEPLAPGQGPTPTEDTVMSGDIAARGFKVGRVTRECVKHLGWDWDAYPDYYEKSAAARGYRPEWLRGHFDRMRELA